MSVPRATALNGGYDQNLLAVTPEISKAARQEGYNVDLLKEDGLPPPPRRNTAHRSTDLENRQYHAQAPYIKENYSGPITPQKLPWWRTQNGIIVIVIILVVIIGAVVGGAVGGTVGHKDKTQINEQPTTNGNSSTAAVDGSGQNTDKKSSSGGGVSVDVKPETTTQAQITEGQNTIISPTSVIRRAW